MQCYAYVNIVFKALENHNKNIIKVVHMTCALYSMSSEGIWWLLMRNGRKCKFSLVFLFSETVNATQELDQSHFRTQSFVMCFGSL